MLEAFAKGVAISLLLVFSVGPVIFTIIKQSINHGRRGGFSFVAGVWLSDIIWVILSNGFSELVKQLMNFKTPIGIAGSLFLIGMGVYYTFLKR
jgi:threonine/homoserine/homoserine lactone efflux protein